MSPTEHLPTTANEVKETSINDKYHKDKNGWVTFIDKRPKIKLRKHITKLAGYLNKKNPKTISYYKEFLQNTYSLGGLKSMHKIYNDLIE